MMKEPIINIEKSSRILRPCTITNKETGETIELRPINCEHFCRVQSMSYLYMNGGEYRGRFGGDISTMPQEEFCDLMDEISEESDKARRGNKWWQDNVFGPRGDNKNGNL